MLGAWLVLLLLLTLLGTVQASTITDNFTDPTNWGIFISQGGGNISVGSGRMNYTSAATNNAGAVIPRNTPLLPTTQDWSLKVDAHLNATTLTTSGQFSDVFLGFGKTGDYVNTHVTFEFGRGYWGNPAHNGYYVGDDIRISGGDTPALFDNWNVTSPDVALRMDYSATNHTVTYYFDGNGATGGYNWVAQGTANLASGTYNLNLSPTDTLTIFLLGSSELQTVTAGQAYLSNLEITVNQTPVVTTGTATAITSTSATVSGTVNPNGLPTTARFEYGLTTNYGNTASVTLSPSNGVMAQAVSANLIGLEPETTYHYRLTGFNSGGVGSGGDASFLTPAETVIEAWVRQDTDLGYNNLGSALAVDSSNNIIVLGDYVVIKYSSMGVPLWTNFNTASSQSLQVDSSNNVIVAGNLYSGSRDYAVIKYSSAGVPLWTNRYDGSLSGDDTLRAMVVDHSDNVIVTGHVPIGTYDRDYCTIKYSAAGVPLWTNLFGRSENSSDYPSAVAIDSSNNVIVTGSTAPDSTGNQIDMATIEYSSAGVPLWTNFHNGPANLNDRSVALVVDGGNNVIVTGSSQMTSGSPGYYMTVTIKYSSAGAPLWSNLRNWAGNNDPTAIAVDSRNNVIVAGYIDGPSGLAFMTIKYSSAGVLLWENAWEATMAADVVVDHNDNIIVTGFSEGYLNTYDFFTIKYSSAGTTVWSMINKGGVTDATAKAVTVDGNNNVIVTGGDTGVAVTVKYVTDGSLPVTFTCLTNNGTLTITGCNASGGVLTIPATINGLPVTSIGDEAFNGNFLTGIFMPNTVTNIGAGAFGNCAKLRSLTIPANVKTIGPGAFGHCDSLAAVSIPNSVQILGYSAFYQCISLTNVTVGYGITNLDDYVFYGCSSLSSITIPNSVVRIGTSAFTGCGSLGSITIPDSVGRIETSAFSYCSSLTSITFGTNVTNLGSSAFADCYSLGSIIIPNSVTSLGDQAFYNCQGLTNVVIPNSLTTIWDRTFFGCTKLTRITIPPSITSIGSGAFADCTSLTGVYFQGNAPSVGSEVFYGANNLTVYYLPGATGWGSTLSERHTEIWYLYPVPPFITTQPQSQPVQFGGSGTFTVVASGGFLNYRWLFNGTTLTNGGNISGATSASISIASVQTNHAGNYYVVVTNTAGSVTSSVAVLTVLTVPATITSQPINRTNSVGTTATFTVSASGTAPLSYRWRLNGTNLMNGGSISGVTDATLSLASVQTNYAGLYSVMVSNAWGVAVSSNAILTVTVPPSLDGALEGSGLAWTTGGTGAWYAQTTTTHDGVDAAQSGLITHSQECWMQTTLTGPGTLTYWRKVSSESGYDYLEFYIDGVLQSGRISGTVDWQKQTNSIPFGSHTVKWRYIKDGSANNGLDAGWVDEVGFVPDGQIPQIDTQPVSIACNKGGTASISATASGTVPLFYQWCKNGTNLFNGGNISGANTTNLTMGNLQNSDGGNFFVIVTNDYGSVTSSVAVLTVIDVASVTLINSVAGQPQLHFIGPAGTYCDLEKSTNLMDWTFVGRALVGNVLDFNQVDPAWRSSARGFFRASQASAQVALPPTLAGHPVGVMALPGESARFVVTATGSLPLQYQWQLNGTNILGATNVSLDLDNLQLDQAGFYSVVVLNSSGSALSHAAVLTVLSPTNGLYITNATLTVDGYANFEVVTPSFGIYSLLISTNLSDWESVETLTGPTNRFFIYSYPTTMAEMGNVFVRVAVGLVPQYQFSLGFSATVGTLVAGTPSISFPQTVQNYSTWLEMNRLANPADGTNVFFTGPPGSGLTNAMPAGSYLDPENFGANYWSHTLTNPSVPPPGTWTVNYGGTNLFFDQPDALAHFVVPHPTVVVSNGVLVSVNWVYRNPTTGQALSASPTFLRGVTVEVFGGSPSQSIYDSDDLSRQATNHVFSSALLWSEVESLSITYGDDVGGDGNEYSVFYTK